MTLKDLLANAVKTNGHVTLLRFKRNGNWEEMSYHQLQTRAALIAQMLHSFSVEPGDRVAIFAENSVEWIESYLGITCMGCTAVPIDSKLREQEVTHILHDSAARVLITTAKSYPILREIEDKLPHLQTVLLIGGNTQLPADSTHVHYDDYHTQVHNMNDTDASERIYNTLQPKPTDVASLIYTSGTTGRPKGAMLTHRNFTSDVEYCRKAFADITNRDNFLLVLPLHHAFAFTTCLLLPIALGGSISIVASLKTLAENMRETRPSVLIGVPLLLEKMYAKISAGIQQKRSARLLMKIGLSKLVGKKILAKLGGNLRIVVTGGAPCDSDLINGWSRLGIIVREGYGLTEASPVVAVNPPARNKPGTVGPPLPGIEMKVVDPNEFGVGEIVLKGDNVMAGYYKNQEATDEIIRDGWLHTGDLGSFDADHYLTISGRKKSLIVNREGKNIYPEEVENQVLKSPYIAEALVLGYQEPGGKAGEKVGVIVVPDQEFILEDKPDLRDEEIERLVQQEVRSLTGKLADYKRPRCIQVRYEEFQKTSTQKVKRYLYAINTSHLN